MGDGHATPLPPGPGVNLRFVSDFSPTLSSGQPPQPVDIADYQLGRRLAGLMAEQTAANLPANAVYSQVQDLLGADTSLLGPLRDLLARPAFRQLFAGDQQSVLLGGRDALLQDLANTYHPAMVARLAAVIDGSLGLPAGPPPSLPAGAGAVAGGSPASAWGTAQGQGGAAAHPWGAASAQGPYSQPSYSQPAYGQAPYGQAPVNPPPQPVPVVVSASGGGGALTAVLIVLVSLLTGAVLLGLGWLLLTNRVQPVSGGAAQAPAPGQAPPAPSTTPSPPPTDKGPTTFTPPTSSSAWGGASEYKFGQLPGGAYPNSCAFSVTDANGRTTTDKSQVEYWACRDVGGSPDSGYRVVWADGKETNYTFQNGGSGQVVGTNGSTYPMNWRNDTHQGDPIVVINHQDGAITWIPGQIN